MTRYRCVGTQETGESSSQNLIVLFCKREGKFAPQINNFY
jgi:hypothetical protein